MRRLTPLLLACLAVALVVAACGGSSTSTTGSGPTAAAAPPTTAAPPATTAPPTTTTRPTTTTPSAPASCRRAAAPGPKTVNEPRPKARLKAGATDVVTFTTSCGAFSVRLDSARQPRTTASFAQLVRDGVYDGLTFHRIVPGFVVQGGDPAGDGSGGPGYTITERPPADAAYTRGVVAMAKTEIEKPGTSGSQFFIVTGRDAQLPPDYALVGTVVGDGMATVDRIAAVPTDSQSRPVSPVVIEKATLRRG